MKEPFRSILLLIAFGLFVWQMTACKRNPAPPTEQDAIAVLQNTHKKFHSQDLISLTKTNGQLSKVNGVAVYTFFYEAKVKDLMQLGNRVPGTIETYQSNYPFQWTEKGWMGPDQKIYPEH